MSKIYDVIIQRQHIDTKIPQDHAYQVVGDDLTHAVFQAGQVYHNDQVKILYLFVSGANPLSDESYEWSAK